ncbi:MAG: PQQ-like beta-propeller repeat protein [Gemmataceae bacterium]|nr:PQQ-like beta-propeller repeat protein [Gemmataceae bacterium]
MLRTSALVCSVLATVGLSTLGADDPQGRPLFSHIVTLPRNEELERRLEVAPDYLKAGDWKRAGQVLQSVLDHTEDGFVPVRRRGPEGKELVGWVSARSEAARLLATLPPRGRELYDLSHGPQAARLLAMARKSGDMLQVALAAQRYPYTTAGREAADLVATHHLDRGEHTTAARHFARLLGRPDSGLLPPLALFKAALAFHRAGETGRAEDTWKRLAGRAPGGIAIGGRNIPLGELKKELARPVASPADSTPLREWVAFRGNAARSAPASGGIGELKARWREDVVGAGEARQWVEHAVSRMESSRQAILPGSCPLALDGKVIFRGRRGLVALDRVSGRLLWEAPLAGSLEQMAGDGTWHPYTGPWATAYAENFPHVVLENSLVGTLSADRRHVYAVEDLELPPFPRDYASFVSRSGQGLRFAAADDLTEGVYKSRLVAVELDTGRVAWKADGPAVGTHVLGPPLVLGGRLYVVTEQQGLRLVCLDSASGRVLWSQALAAPRNNVLVESARRLWAAHPAHAEGVMVCPTNGGAVVAVDLAGRGLLWAHSYRDQPPPPEQPPLGRRIRPAGRAPNAPTAPNMDVKWRLCAPLIHQGKVLLTAPDSGALECLDLWTGALLWRVERQDGGLYLAGTYRDRVLVAGQQHFGALRLSNGGVLWSVETGMPSGQGVLAGKVYYLPVQRCAQTGGPALQGVDVEKGAVVSRTPVPGGEAPGNLVLYEGDVISQTVLRVTAYARPTGATKE